MNIHWLKMTDSTNLDAWRNKDTAEDMTVWCAEYQTAGRGQRGNRWESRQGENLMFSILFRPRDLKAAGQFVISQICSVGIVRYLSDLGLDARIKWPNDIYIGDRKICGMLIENTLKGDTLAVSIAGIGLNVNQRVFPPELPNPTSVLLSLEETGPDGSGMSPLSSREELPRLLRHVFGLYGQLEGSGHVPGLEEEYVSLLYRKGVTAEFEETELITGGGIRRFQGRILGVEKDTARLLVKKEDGQVAKYYFKEIRFVL